jgi:hypothetical protein
LLGFGMTWVGGRDLGVVGCTVVGYVMCLCIAGWCVVRDLVRVRRVRC